MQVHATIFHSCVAHNNLEYYTKANLKFGLTMAEAEHKNTDLQGEKTQQETIGKIKPVKLKSKKEK